jgi:cytochrome oxidase assembly protein ShyY1
VSERDAEDTQQREHRTFVNLAAAIAMLILAISGIWLLGFLDEKRKLQACIEAGRRDCLQRFDPAPAPPR